MRSRKLEGKEDTSFVMRVGSCTCIGEIVNRVQDIIMKSLGRDVHAAFISVSEHSFYQKTDSSRSCCKVIFGFHTWTLILGH